MTAGWKNVSRDRLQLQGTRELAHEQNFVALTTLLARDVCCWLQSPPRRRGGRLVVAVAEDLRLTTGPSARSLTTGPKKVHFGSLVIPISLNLRASITCSFLVEGRSAMPRPGWGC